MELFNFYTAHSQLYELYGIEMSKDRFENMGIIAYGKIGNKSMITKSITVKVGEDGIVKLPCEVDKIEAVTVNRVTAPRTSVIKDSWDMQNEQYIEDYIEYQKGDRSELYTSGDFVKYTQIDQHTIKLYLKNIMINVLYKSSLTDDNDLPLLNEKEVNAIAAYCAYADTFRKGLSTRDGGTIQMAQMLEQQWLKLCDQARVPMSMSQNDFDEIGNIMKSWDRKTYGKSYKPIR